MTTLLVIEYADGTRRRCNAYCHNGAHASCTCPCGGAYHGIGSTTRTLSTLVAEYQPRILAALGVRETRGELWIAGWRDTLEDTWHRRPKGKPRAYQDALAL